MKEFIQILELIDTLLGPNGCPWDKEQTFESLRETVTEEAYELVEAIDLNDKEKILEELGDLFFNAIFFCKLGEKEEVFSTEKVLQELYDKLVRRHPHVFGETVIGNVSELYEQWEQIKSEEKGHQDRKSALDGIPVNFPSLSRAQKMIKKFKKVDYTTQVTPSEKEEEIGMALFSIVKEAQNQGIDAEGALRKILTKEEALFRAKESTKK